MRAAEDVGPYRLFDFPFVRDDKSNQSRSSCGNATCGIDPDSGTAPLIPCDSRSTYQSENFHCPPPSTFSTSFRDHPPSCCKCGVLKHFTVIFEKLGVANRTEAVALALNRQMLKAAGRH